MGHLRRGAESPLRLLGGRGMPLPAWLPVWSRAARGERQMKSYKTVTGILTTLALLAGCYSDVPGQGDGSANLGDGAGVQGRRRELKGGSRLKAKIVTGEDGSEAATGLYDTKLGVNCAFSVAEDGKTRCLPTDVAKAMDAVWVSRVASLDAEQLYADAACTRHAGVSPLCQPPVKYIRYAEGCGTPSRIAEANESGNLVYFRDIESGTCGAITQVTVRKLGYRFYEAGRVVPASEFVAGAQTLE